MLNCCYGFTSERRYSGPNSHQLLENKVDLQFWEISNSLLARLGHFLFSLEAGEQGNIVGDITFRDRSLFMKGEEGEVVVGIRFVLFFI